MLDENSSSAYILAYIRKYSFVALLASNIILKSDFGAREDLKICIYEGLM